jgi:hypothetical protein
VFRDTVIGMNETEPKSTSHPRTGAATAGKMRASENRGAAKLEGRGWACYPPEEAEWVRSLVAAAREQKANPR